MDKNVYKKAGKFAFLPELEITEVEPMQSERDKASEFQLQIRLFGAFDVRIDGAPIPPLRTRKVQWLLALLVLHQGQTLDRAWLAGTLWPDSTPDQSLYNLRQSLSNLRQALGTARHCLHASTSNTLVLDPSAVEADVLTFDAAIASEDPAVLEQAVALYRGPLLEGCVEEWVFAERRAREENYLGALESLADRALTCGESGVAINYLRKVIRLDPLRERAQRALIQALAGQGDYGAAVQTYRELRLLLHRELQSEPDPDTLAVFQRVRTEARRKRQAQAVVAFSDTPASSAPAPAPPSEPVRQLPHPLTTLVGRQSELEQIVPTLNAVRLLTLTGPGGVGKTRLAIAAAEQLQNDYPNGVFFIDLAPLSDPALVVQAVARAMQVRDVPGTPLLSTLQAALQAKALLL